MIDAFLDAAESLLSPQMAAVVLFAVIVFAIAIGVVLSFRRTVPPADLREWLTNERIDGAFRKTFGASPAPQDRETFRNAILHDVASPTSADSSHSDDDSGEIAR